MNDDRYRQAAYAWVQLLLIAIFAIICAGIVYSLAQPLVNEVIELWSFAV